VGAFAHEALFYTSSADFLEGAVPFIDEGLSADEPVLVAVPGERIALLRESLGADADRVGFIEMTSLGRNPARIISAWRDFLVRSDAARRPVRGIGEPIWPGRDPDEIVECHRHESLINLAFDDGPPWQLLCPYDVSRLDPDVIAGAMRSHPVVRSAVGQRASADYAPPARELAPEDDLPRPSAPAGRQVFARATMAALRRTVSRAAAEAGLGDQRCADAVLAVSEIATNSVRYGGGGGELAWWREPQGLVVEVRDRGRIRDPLVGRARPTPSQSTGRGMWLAYELADLVQVRTLVEGTVVRLHFRTP
jgi:anti-sigma regulatory factor (Ser/Thr protein kinase)